MTSEQIFGSNLVAMVTPMHRDGSLDEQSLHRLVERLIETGCDGIVVAGTAGEAPTLTEAETAWLVGSVVDGAAGRVRVIAGVGTNDTASTLARARQAETAGANALLLVCPYYSKPTQAGIIAHCGAVADATELPVMLYDVPVRTGVEMETSTLIALSAHPRILAVKDAKGDLFEAVSVMSTTSLAYYCGIDELNLPYLAIGATGLVSVVGNVVAEKNADLIGAVRGGDLPTARAIANSMLPFVDAVMRTSQGSIMAKAALAEIGIIDEPTVRLPLLQSPPEHQQRLADAMVGIT